MARKRLNSRRRPRFGAKNAQNVGVLPQDLRFSTHIIRGPKDPPVQAKSKAFYYTARLSVANGSLNWFPATISTELPGTVATITSFRIRAVHFYGGSASEATQLYLYWVHGDTGDFSDAGTIGAVRPSIHLEPGMFTKITWFASNDAITTLFSTTTSGALPALMDVDLECRTEASP